jgi:hypothetical protein
MCVPPTATPGVQLTFEAAETCGTCGDNDTSCRVRPAASGGFDIEIQHTHCETGTACVAACLVAKTSCVLPVLAEGTYAITLNGQPMPPLVVQAGGSSSCTL